MSNIEIAGMIKVNRRNSDEIGISRATFLDLVEPGTLVKFKGTLVGSSITWEEAELEDD